MRSEYRPQDIVLWKGDFDVKPAVFDYVTPKTLEEAFSLLDEYGFDSKIISGGQSLVPMMNMRLARPEVLIDINELKEIEYINVTDKEIQIGGLTRQYRVENSKELQEACPLLTEGMTLIGHSQIRSRGTVGGSITHADPTAELPVILATLDGTITLGSSEGMRTLTPDEFFLTYLTTTIEPNEILCSITIPRTFNERTGYAIEEFTLRKGDFAIVLAAAIVTLDDEGKVSSAKLTVGGVDGIPVVVEEVVDDLIGKLPTDEKIEACCEQIVDLIDPEPDIHASVEYRKDLSVTLSQRVLKKAVERANKK